MAIATASPPTVAEPACTRQRSSTPGLKSIPVHSSTLLRTPLRTIRAENTGANYRVILPTLPAQSTVTTQRADERQQNRSPAIPYAHSIAVVITNTL